ncbi:hypothetical protein HLB35_15830 [Halomonas sp. TBZ9]|uniref:Uncharacterized protein n=1 Tax=Vreelandella azerica TaxID=2732867 RepID=A0A7Y3XBZ7_9GAMM|nr:hypothetical protein [Halomonas azerica]NOG32864.1 hypothetical protein [Halomonas azerica]
MHELDHLEWRLAERNEGLEARLTDAIDARKAAAALVDQPRQPLSLPEPRGKNSMIGESVIQRAAAMERQQAAEHAKRNARPMGFTFDL